MHPKWAFKKNQNGPSARTQCGTALVHKTMLMFTDPHSPSTQVCSECPSRDRHDCSMNGKSLPQSKVSALLGLSGSRNFLQ